MGKEIIRDSQIERNKFQLLVKETPVANPDAYELNAGITVAEIISKAPKVYDQPPAVYLNGEKAKKVQVIRSGDLVEVVLVPQVATTLAIAGGILLGYLGARLFKPPMPDGTPEEEQFSRITGLRNETPLYKPVPTLLGSRKVAPHYLARPYTLIEGDKEYFYALMSTGYGPQELKDFTIAGAPLDTFEHEITVVDHYETTDTQPIFEAYDADITQENVDVALESPEELNFNNGTGNIQYNTRALDGEAKEVLLDFLWPQGSFRVTRSRGRTEAIESCARVDYEQDGVRKTLGGVQRWVAGGVRSTIYGAVTQVPNLGWRMWTRMDASANEGNAASLSIPVTVEGQERDGIVKLLNVPQNIMVATVWHKSPIKKARAKAVSFLTDSNSPVVLYVGKTIPTQAYKDELNPTDAIQWLNVKVKRPLTAAQFDKAIGGDRPRLRYEGSPSGGIRTYRPTLIALKLKATGQLSGQLDNFFCQATTCVPVNKDIDWRNWPSLTLEPSNNPADMYKWLMQGPMNYSPIPNAKINNSNLAQWRQRCVDEDWSISAWIDYEGTLLSELKNVAFTGRAEFGFDEGKFGVVEKIERTIPVQMFTNKNSANFQSSRQYPEDVDGIRFEFDSAEIDYEQDEGVFLDPIKAQDESLLRGRYERMSVWGTDNFDQAYRLARFQYYETFLQREVYTLDTDVESIRCKRGDLVYVQNDIIEVGLGAGRVTQVTSNGVIIDEQIGLDDVSEQLAIMFRMSDGSFEVENATHIGNGEWELDTPANVKRGDLVTYGVAGRTVLPCYVYDIQYGQNLTAKVTLKNAISYDFDEEPIPEYQPAITPNPVNEVPDAPVIYETPSVDLDRGLVTLTLLNVDTLRQQGLVYNVQMREYRSDQDESAATDWETLAVGLGQALELSIDNLTQGYTYQFRIQARRSNSTFSAWSNVASIEIDFGSEMNPLDNLVFEHTESGTLLRWLRIENPFFDLYEIRSNDNFGDEEDEAGLIDTTKSTTFNIGYLTSNQTYYIAAKNTAGRYGGSAEITVQPPVVNPVVNLRGNSEPSSSAFVEWDEPTNLYGLRGYKVKRNLAGEAPDEPTATQLGFFDATHVDVRESLTGTYNYWVSSIDNSGRLSGWESIAVEFLITLDESSQLIIDAQERLDDLRQDLTVVEFDVGELEQGFQQATQDLEDARDRLQIVEFDVDDLDQGLQGLNDSLSEARDEIDAAEIRIANTEQALGQAEDRISDAEDNISQVGSDLADESNRIDGVTTRVAEVEGKTVDIDVRIDGVDSRIDLVDLDIDDVRENADNIKADLHTATKDYKLRLELEAREREASDRELLSGIIERAEKENELARRQRDGERLIDAVVTVDRETGQIINRAFQYTDEQFTEAEFLIDGVEAQVEIAVSRVSFAEDEIENLDARITALPAQIQLQTQALIAEAVSALEPAHAFNFFDSTQGWVAVNGTITSTSNLIELEWGDIENTELNYDAQENPLIRIAVERVAGTGWTGDIEVTFDDDSTELFTGVIDEITEQQVGTRFIRNIDFRGSENYSGTITGVRLILGESSVDEFRVDSITIGKPEAALQELEGIQARLTTAEVNINALDEEISLKLDTTVWEQEAVTISNIGLTLENQFGLPYAELVAQYQEIDENDVITNATQAGLFLDGYTGNIGLLSQQLTTEIVDITNENIDDKVDPLISTVDTLSVELDQANNTIRNTVTSVSGIRGELRDSELQQALSEVEIGLYRLGIADNGVKIARAISELQAFTTPEGAFGQAVTELEAGIVGVGNSVSTLSQEVNTRIDGVVSSSNLLETRVTDAEGDIEATNALLQNAELDSEGNTKATNALEARVGDTEQGIQATNTLLQEAELDSEGNTKATNVLASRIDSAEIQLSANTSLIQSAELDSEGNTKATTILESRLDDAENDISANAGLIQQVEQDANNNTSAISALTTRVEDTESELSSTTDLIQQSGLNAQGDTNALVALRGRVDNAEQGISANTELLQQSGLDSDGNTSALNILRNEVEDIDSGLSATNTLLQNAELDSEGNTKATTILESRLDDAENDISANAGLIQQVEKDAGDNTSAISALTTRVEDAESELSSTTELIQQSGLNAQGDTTAVVALRGRVDNAESGLSANTELLQQSGLDSQGNTTAVNTLRNRVQDAENDIGATNTLLQEAELDSEGNTKALTQLASRVQENENFAVAQLELNSEYENEFGNLSARASLTTNVNNQITGVIIDDDGQSRRIEFLADSVGFVDANDNLKVFYDLNNDRYVFDGEIQAQSGVFGGTLQAADGTFGGTLTSVDGIFTGALQAASGTFSGTLTSADGVFTGSLTGVDGTFEGTLSGGEVQGSTITGGVIQTSDGTDFRTVLDPANGFPLWYGAGNVNEGNGLFFLTDSGEAVFKGSLQGASGTFGGTLTAGSIITDSTITGGVIQTSDGTDFRTVLDPSSGYAFWYGAGAVNDANGTFYLKSDGLARFKGELQAASGSFGGELLAASGTFGGQLVAASGTFEGTVSAGTVQGGNVNGSTITGGVIRTSSGTGFRTVIDPSNGYALWYGSGTVNDTNAQLMFKTDGTAEYRGFFDGTLAANTVSANNIQIGAVGQSKLKGKPDFSNLVPNGSFESGDFDGWTSLDSGLSVTARGSRGDSASRNQPFNFAMIAPSDGQQYQQWGAENVSISAGEELACEFYMAAAGSSPRSTTWQIRVRFDDSDGNLIAIVVREASTSSVSWSKAELEPIIAPSGAVNIRQINIRRTGGGSGSSYISGISVRRRNAAALIVDGGIQADQLSADAIDGKTITGATVQTSSNTSDARTILEDDGTYLIWAGEGAKNDSNARFFIKKDGTGFVAGEFFQGELIESQAGSGSFSATASGHISSGKPVKVSVDALITGRWQGNQMDETGILRATITRNNSQIAQREYPIRGNQFVSEGTLNETLFSGGQSFFIIDDRNVEESRNYTVQLTYVAPSGVVTLSQSASCSIETFENKLST